MELKSKKLLQQTLQITTILVTHDQREAMTLADTIVVMADGKVQQIGPPTEIYRAPANRFVATFIGQSNLLAAEVADRRQVRLMGQLFEVEAMPDSLRAGDGVALSIRPEDIRIVRQGGGDRNTLPARFIFVRDVGGSIEFRLDCAGHEIIGTSSPAAWAGTDIDAAVAVELPAAACTILAG